MTTKKVQRPFKYYHNNYTRKQLAVRFELMAAKFEKQSIVSKRKGKNCFVDMNVGMVYTYGDCGTVACHGGWAGIVLGVKGADVGFLLYYKEGAEALAQFLGFPTQYCLISWAQDYPNYWGNIFGCAMFKSEKDAFISGDFLDPREQERILDLPYIAKWYREVATRLRYDPDIAKLNKAYQGIAKPLVLKRKVAFNESTSFPSSFG